MGAVRLTRYLHERGFEVTTATVTNCLNRSRHHERGGNTASDNRPTTEIVAERLGRVASLLERSGIDPEDIGKVKAVRLSEWQGLTKNDDGEAEIHNLEGASILLTPAWEDGPKWPVVQPAKPVIIRPFPKPRAVRSAGEQVAVIVPDVQIGFRRDIQTAQLDAFHDEAAMAAALAVIRQVSPSLVVLLGDFLDFANFGTFELEAGFALTVQPAIDRAHRFLVEIMAAAPGCEIVLLEGNHDRRLQKATLRNARESFGLKRADSQPDEWPVLSVPFLLRLDELNVEYVGGYPAGIYWLNDRLACVHGSKVRSTGSTAQAVVDDERISVIFGHVHRIEQAHRTRRVRDGHRVSVAASPGCLCRIDGTVPSTKGSTDPLGRPIQTAENWQQGVAVVTYEEGDGPFGLELVPIFDGVAHFRGERLAA